MNTGNKMKTLIIILLLVSFTYNGYGEMELKHVISDGEFWYSDIWKRIDCIEGEHLEINLSKKDWYKIVGRNTGIKVHFSAQFCVKCRLISVSCAGNDWYRLELEKEKDDKITDIFYANPHPDVKYYNVYDCSHFRSCDMHE